MGSRAGRGNRLKWSTAEILDTLARSVTKKELIEGFRALPIAAQIDVLIRLSDSATPDGSEGGSEHGK
jgi:hypothetical protein